MKHNLWSHSSQILTNINTKTHKTDATIKKFKDWQIVCSQNLEEFLTVSQKECKLNDRNCGRLCDSWKKPCFFFFFPLPGYKKTDTSPSPRVRTKKKNWCEWSQTGTASRSSQGTAPSPHLLSTSIQKLSSSWKTAELQIHRTPKK